MPLINGERWRHVFNHEPADYECPFCRLVAGGEGPVNGQRDIVHQTELATALISPRWWPNNHGHVLVVPNAHHENIFDVPRKYGHGVHDLVREIAIAMRRTYGCDGISTRQHNEPGGNQDAWHYHVHVFPRYHDDRLYGTRPYPGFVEAHRRWPYAQRLRDYLAVHVTRAHYDDVAHEFEQRSREPYEELQAHLDAFREQLPPDARVADVGCGPGRDTALLRERGLRVLGLDLSMGMLRVIERDDVAQADMRMLPIRTAGLDGVWCNAAMLHLPLADVPRTVAEFARVLRPGGALHLLVAEGDGEGWQVSPYDKHRRRWFSHHREEPLARMLADAGLEVSYVERRSRNRDWLLLRATRTG